MTDSLSSRQRASAQQEQDGRLLRRCIREFPELGFKPLHA